MALIWLVMAIACVAAAPHKPHQDGYRGIVVEHPDIHDKSRAGASPLIRATVTLVPAGGSRDKVQGSLALEENEAGVLLRGSISGLQPGSHGLHVHEGGSTADQCNAAGAHFNPSRMNHGNPSSDERHVGDLGNVATTNSGETNVIIFDSKITLNERSANSILGRTLVVHANLDDLGRGGNRESLLTGNAGARLACGIIQLS